MLWGGDSEPLTADLLTIINYTLPNFLPPFYDLSETCSEFTRWGRRKMWTGEWLLQASPALACAHHSEHSAGASPRTAQTTEFAQEKANGR